LIEAQLLASAPFNRGSSACFIVLGHGLAISHPSIL
jgi:hypothetical protein